MRWDYEVEVYDFSKDEDNFFVSGWCYADDEQAAVFNAMQDVNNRYGDSIRLYQFVKLEPV